MIYVSDTEIEERAYRDHADLLGPSYILDPGCAPDPIALRVTKRQPNPRFSPTAAPCPDHVPAPHQWGTHSTWGRAYCSCGAFWFDRYHSDPTDDDPYHDARNAPCRIIETTEVMYSRRAGAIYGIAECGELVLWVD